MPISHFWRRSKSNGIASVIALFAISSGAAASQVPADFSTMPLYFSGAACRASGIVEAGDGIGPVIWMDLFINGDLVAHWDWFQDTPFPPAGLQVMFDSSHFAHGSTVLVEFDAYFEGGGSTHASGSSAVKNSAVLYGRNDFEVTGHVDQKGFPAVIGSLAASNYDTPVTVTTLGWADYNFLAALESDKNVSYVHTHGEAATLMPNLPFPVPGAAWITSDYDELSNPPGPVSQFYVDALEVYASRQLAIGSGNLPPYNPSGKPPLNIAFNDCCATGINNTFAEAYLWPYANAYGGWTECQSQLGWSVIKYSLATKVSMLAFWGHLQQGYTADEARLQAEATYRTWVLYNVGDIDLPDQRLLLHCYGDWYTRLHGVYSGTDADSPMLGWYGPQIIL